VPDRDWWLVGNSNYGMHTAQGHTARDAKADVRARIAETYAGEGLPPSACRRAASSYRVFVVAGHLTQDCAREAREAWDRGEYETAELLSKQHRRRRRNRESTDG
jgi:hypothetical protein